MFQATMRRQTSVLLKALALLYAEILHSHRHCEYVVHVTNATEPFLDTLAGWDFAGPEILLTIAQFTVSNSNNGSLRNREHWQSNTRFGHCFFFVHEINEDGRLLSNWSETLTFGGSPYQNFHVFLLMSATDLLGFAKSTRKLYHAVHLHPENSQAVRILKISSSGLTLRHVLTCTTVDAAAAVGPKNGILLFEERPNLEKMHVRLLRNCGKIGCEARHEEFKRTGRWHSMPLACAQELSQQVNGTMMLVGVFTPPTDGKDQETGKWDEWTQPLVDGNAMISVVLPITVEKSKVLLTTTPISFNTVAFITGKARKVGSARSWAKLLTPLTPEVWLYCLSSVLALVVTVKCILRRSSVTQHGSKIAFTQLAAVFLKPAVGQAPLVGEEGNFFGNDNLARYLVATWLISLIILVCGYTSTMTAQIVLPRYENMPSTFEELANSDFKLFGKYIHGNIEKYFESLNNSVGNKILSSVSDTGAVSTECLRAVLEPRKACISLSVIFRVDESGILLDEYGREVFVMSKDQPTFATAKFTMSKLHPAVFGVTDLWMAESIRRSLRIAKSEAKAKGSKWEVPAEENRTASMFLLELLLIGQSTSVVVLVIEVVACRWAIIMLIQKIIKRIKLTVW